MELIIIFCLHIGERRGPVLSTQMFFALTIFRLIALLLLWKQMTFKLTSTGSFYRKTFTIFTDSPLLLLLGLLLGPEAGPGHHDPPHLPGRHLDAGPLAPLPLSSFSSGDVFVYRHRVADNLLCVNYVNPMEFNLTLYETKKCHISNTSLSGKYR